MFILVCVLFFVLIFLGLEQSRLFNANQELQKEITILREEIHKLKPNRDAQFHLLPGIDLEE